VGRLRRELQKKKYPKMQQIGDRFGVSNSVEDSYKTAVDQMRANPDLKGFLIFGANGPIGAGQAVGRSRQDRQSHRRRSLHPEPGTEADEAGRHHPRLPVNPIDSGYALVALGKVLASGGEIKDGWICPAWVRAR
jgi:simple sugar transport system substrate-binding protein